MDWLTIIEALVAVSFSVVLLHMEFKIENLNQDEKAMNLAIRARLSIMKHQLETLDKRMAHLESCVKTNAENIGELAESGLEIIKKLEEKEK